MKRRDFLATSAAAGAGLVLPLGAAHGATTLRGRQSADHRELAMRALDAARGAGAAYADVRVSRNRNQSLSTRERQITSFDDSETFGFGVRVLANGTWGFAASRELSLDEADHLLSREPDAGRSASTKPPAHRRRRTRMKADVSFECLEIRDHVVHGLVGQPIEQRHVCGIGIILHDRHVRRARP